MSSAPSAVSDMIRQHIQFSGTGDTLSLRGLIAVANVGTPAVSGEFAGMIDGNSEPVYSMRLSPTNPIGLSGIGTYINSAFISPALDLLGSAFTRYRAKQCKFFYRPQSGTDSTQQMVFAFAADPCHPLIAPATLAAPSVAGLESLADSIPFAPWAAWDLDVSRKLSKEWLYTQESTDGSSSGSPDNRFDSFGSIGCVVSSASTSTAVNYGVLYMEFDLEFKEFCPISVTRPSMLRALSKKINFHLERHMSGFTKEGNRSTLNCDSGDLCDDLTHSPPLPKEPTKPRELPLQDFIKIFQTLRRDNKSAGEAVSRISSCFVLTSECLELVFKSGLMDYLKYPTEPSKSSCLVESGGPPEQKGSVG